jgi:hypothetical protein
MPPDDHNFMLHSHDQPKNWKAALASDEANEWIEARLAEKNSFREHDVLQLVPRSDATNVGAKIYHSKIVLKKKMNPPTPAEPEGSVDKFKYRLVIAAFTKMMTQGIDYAEKHANQVRWNAVLVLIATAVIFDLDITLFDIRTFFLTGELDEDCDVYMEQPEGWEPPDKPRKDFICKLKKSMYGLPQASHVAQVKLKATLTKNGKFKATDADDCVFVSTTPPTAPGYAVTGTHVDDLISIGDRPGLDKLEGELRADFNITVKHAPTLIMAVEVDRKREKKWLKLHQTAYTTALLTKHQMLNCTPTDTPMDAGTAKALMQLPVDKPDPAIKPPSGASVDKSLSASSLCQSLILAPSSASLLRVTASSGASVDKSLSTRLLCHSHILAPAPEAHSPRLHQRRNPCACTRGAIPAPAPEVHSARLHQRRTPRACTRGALPAPAPEAHFLRLHQRRTSRACTRGALDSSNFFASISVATFPCLQQRHALRAP